MIATIEAFTLRIRQIAKAVWRGNRTSWRTGAAVPGGRFLVDEEAPGVPYGAAEENLTLRQYRRPHRLSHVRPEAAAGKLVGAARVPRRSPNQLT